jgi:hypothetical protein
MKVKELIEQLLKLDQEKNIWVRYDGVYFYRPEIEEETISEWEEMEYKDQGVKEGDYCI